MRVMEKWRDMKETRAMKKKKKMIDKKAMKKLKELKKEDKPNDGVYICPNCGRTKTYDSDFPRGTLINCYYCGYPIKKVKDVEKIRHPELVPERKVIGDVPSSGGSTGRVQVQCPYCHSTKTERIGVTDILFSIRPGTMFKEWHCNTCGSDF